MRWAAWLVGCATSPTGPGAEATPVATPSATVCPDLPTTAPEGARIEINFHDYERPEALKRYWLYDVIHPCDAEDVSLGVRGLYAERVCVPRPTATIAALWAELTPLRTIAARPALSRPHHGGQSLAVVWSTGRCDADLAQYTDHSPAEEAALRKVIDAVWKAGE